jgi:hypothetical protein
MALDQIYDHNVRVEFRSCKFPTTLTQYSATDFVQPTVTLLVVNSSDTSAAAEYQYYYRAGQSQVEDETGIYRDGSTAFPSGQRISLKCITGADIAPSMPFEFEAPTRFAELSGAADTMRLYLMSSSTLTDVDVRVEAWYPDGTVKNQYNLVENANFDPFATGTALTTNTEAWTGRTTENRYQIDLDTAGDAGADCVPIIRIYVSKPSTTIYFDTTMDLV